MSDHGPFNFGFLTDYGVPLARFAAGEILFRRGEGGDWMLLVLEGRIEIRVGETTLETVGLHGIAGEMALIDTSPRAATAVAATSGEMAIIDQATFLDLIREDPAFSLYVMRILSRRIRRMNQPA